MLKQIVSAGAVVIILCGVLFFGIAQVHWRKDQWSGWRNEWADVFTVPAHHPFTLITVGVIILMLNRAFLGPDAK